MAEEVEDFEEDFGSRMIGTRLADDTKNQYEQKVKNFQLPGNCTRKIVSKLNQMRPRRSETSSFAISAKLPNENDVWERTQ
jgi:hypothetical protein